MSSFAMMMLVDGVEVELPTDLTAVITILDKEVPYFSCEGRGYSVTAGKAVLGKQWDLIVKSFEFGSRDLTPTPLGRIELENLDNETVQLRFPPRSEQEIPESVQEDPEGRIFGSFIYQTLNALQRYQLLELPGVIPTV
jgi:hypothetical protein